ncbi:MAG: hypothetical protein B6D64_03530 [Bacteroidetes bacterium 4484_276]|nr:MAG: hypothetical protein B6D64_03530 [Bacteroidetes bacterium 4484_276]
MLIIVQRTIVYNAYLKKTVLLVFQGFIVFRQKPNIQFVQWLFFSGYLFINKISFIVWVFLRHLAANHFLSSIFSSIQPRIDGISMCTTFNL